MLSRLCFTAATSAFPRHTLGSVKMIHAYRTFHYTAQQTARTSGIGTRLGQQIGMGMRAKAGPTLRERLLGPTSGKPFIYGTYALAGASVFGIGMLCYYGLGLSKGQGLNAMERSTLWGEHVKQRLRQTYGYLAGSLALTAGAGVMAARSPAVLNMMSSGNLLFFIGSLAAIVGTGMLVQSIPYENTGAKHLAWAAHCAVLGAILAPMCYMGGPAMMRAAWYTAGLCAGLSATAICAPSERFLMMGGPLAMGLGVVFVANIGSFFFPAHTALGAGLASIVVYGGLILFSAFLLYDTQKIIKRAEITPVGGATQTFFDDHGQTVQVRTPGYDPINAQLSLYMDILNIFIRMAMIVGGGNQRRK